MRILPIINANRSFVNNSKNAHKNTNNINTLNSVNNTRGHKYTGVASADLAYASLFDNEIAKDLKMMGLI